MKFTYEYISSQASNEKFNSILQVREFLSSLNKEYCNHDEWFAKMSRAFLTGQNREIIVCRDDNGHLAGTIILKRDINERKICSLKVSRKFQRHGVGKNLFEKGFVWLDTDTPFFTVSSLKLHQFKPLFKYYGFKVEQSYKNRYSFGFTEYSYNGLLKESTLISSPANFVLSDRPSLIVPVYGI